MDSDSELVHCALGKAATNPWRQNEADNVWHHKDSKKGWSDGI